MKKIVLIVILFIGFSVFSQKSNFKTYRVSASETISSIARKIGVTPYDLIKLNPDAVNGINVDEVLIIPNNRVTIDRSQQKTLKEGVVIPRKVKDSVVVGDFIYHTVRPLETIYSLSNKYGVSKRKIRKLNKLNRKGDISVGQVLKFPANSKNSCAKKEKKAVESIETVSTGKKEPSNKYLLYLVKPKDTYYTLSRVYHVSEEELKRINPILKDGLKSGFEIKIPAPKDNVTVVNNEIIIPNIETNVTVPSNLIISDTITQINNPIYKTHIVQQKEGFFRLKQLYGFTQEEFVMLNPELKDGLKLGMEIKIPIKVEEALMLEGDLYGKTLNLVLMLPFKADSNISFDKNSTNARRLNGVTDFYLGSLMALDSIKKKGLSVNVKVFDTKNSDFVVNKILNTYNFEETDVVIAPIKFDQFTTVSAKLEKMNIPVISPVSTRDCSVLGLKNSVQNMPTKEIAKNKMLDYILANISNQNIVIITDEDVVGVSKSTYNINLIKSKLMDHDSINSIKVMRMKDGYIKRELFEESIVETKDNWVILASDDKKTASIAIDNLGVFPSSYNIKLYALSKFKDLSSKNTYLNKLHFQYPESTFIDERNNKIINFDNSYTIKYGGSPTYLSYKGFDTTYDALVRLGIFENIENSFKAGKSYRLISQFDYKQNISQSFFNSGVFLVKYNNYSLELVR